MERAALIGGIILAIVVGIGALVPGGLIHIHGDWDDGWGGRQAAYVQPEPGQLAAQTHAAQVVMIRNAAAVVEVIPEERMDVSVEIDNPGKTPMPTVDRDGDRLVIDGLLARRIERCGDEGVQLRQYGRVARTDLPRIVLRTPMDMDLRFRGAIAAEIGAGRSLDLRTASCTDVRAGDMTGDVEVSAAGSGEIEVGASARADVDLSGSGSVRIGPTGGDLNVDVAGSGTARVASFVGESADVDVAGSGGVQIGVMRSRTVEIDIAGSGDIAILDGAVEEADISIAGSGDVDINATLERLETDIAGSGDVTVRRAVQAVNARLVGSGDVILAEAAPRTSKSAYGSGDVIVRASVARAATAPAAPTAPAASTAPTRP